MLLTSLKESNYHIYCNAYYITLRVIIIIIIIIIQTPTRNNNKIILRDGGDKPELLTDRSCESNVYWTVHHCNS